MDIQNIPIHCSSPTHEEVPLKSHEAIRGYTASLCHRVRAVALAAVLVIGAIFLAIPTLLMFPLPCTRRLSKEMFMHITTSFTFMMQHVLDAFATKKLPVENLVIGSDAPELQKWHYRVNLGLLRDAYHQAKSPEVKRQLAFLARNYLDKSAPYSYNVMQLISPRIIDQLRYGSRSSFHYHRMAPDLAISLGRKLGRSLPMARSAPLVPLDSSEIQHLLPLYFTTGSVENIKKALKTHLLLSSLSQPLSRPILFDVPLPVNTKSFKSLEKHIGKMLDGAISSLESDPEVGSIIQGNRRKIGHFLRANTQGISRITRPEYSGVKLLPLFNRSFTSGPLSQFPEFFDFIANAGLQMNRLEMRRLQSPIFEDDDSRYSVSGSNVVYFNSVGELPALSHLAELDLDSSRPETHMVQGTVKILQGIARKTKKEDWEKINQNPATRLAMQQALVKIQVTLATIQEACIAKAPFHQILEELEIVHAEMTTLLELLPPIRGSMTRLYRQRLDCIPETLKPRMHAGLARTSMNVVAGVRSAVSEMQEGYAEAHCHELYYEQVRENSGHVDQTTEGADLYLTQFHPNMEIRKQKTHYEKVDVIADVRKLLDQNGPDRPLTVVVDTTIDYLNSDAVRELLETYKSEIEEGRLNFVIMRSGQKTDMFGMDNYYGAPFYVINNNDPKWAPFKRLRRHPAHATDRLTRSWFYLSTKYAFDEMEAYRRHIFENNRAALGAVPEALDPVGDGSGQNIRVNTVSDQMHVTFVDIKVQGLFHKLRAFLLFSRLYYRCVGAGVKGITRPSFGFAHINATLINSFTEPGVTSIRVNLGVDVADQAPVKKFLEDLARISK